MAVVPFRAPYDEALALLTEARDYLAGRGVREQARLPLDRRLVFSCESLRMTSRLIHCMAWLMIRRAVDDGEISEEAAMDPEWRLEGQDICRADAGVTDIDTLPREFRRLLDLSARFYERISRLDQGMRRLAA
jgi:regulator of CtrA degradation